MLRIPIRRPFPAIAFAAVVACTTPTGLCGCLSMPPHTIVYGRVADAAGRAAPGAYVRVERGPASCQPLDGGYEVQADAFGAYRVMADAPGTQGRMCVRLVARVMDPDGPRYSEPVQFTLALPHADPPDSVRHDLVFPVR